MPYEISPDEVRDEDIAVIGAAVRLPGANDLETFWANQQAGVESIRQLTAAELSNCDAKEIAHPDYVPKWAGVEGADCFDADFFGMTPSDADYLDPQQRVMLEGAWHALEDAGYDPARPPGSIGVFAGAGTPFYSHRLFARTTPNDLLEQMRIKLSSDPDFLSTRIAYSLNLKGPAITVQTACSTSLVAVHLASQALLSGECELALAGGVSLPYPLPSGYRYRPGMVLSSDGRCRAFDARAEGTVFSSGMVILVLRRALDAVEADDRIIALSRGCAVNNDGSLKLGFAAPSSDGQCAVIGESLAMAEVNPDTIGYVECHGTGTPLGDPIELEALTRAWREHTERRNFCAVGSLKTTIGHTDTAAGAGGLLRAALGLSHKTIPPHPSFESPNPRLSIDRTPFYVPNNAGEWPRRDGPRRAAVSAFGVGGTNAHAILQEAPVRRSADAGRPVCIVPVSAHNRAALDEASRNLAGHFASHPDIALADAAFTLQLGRAQRKHRRVVVASSLADASLSLSGGQPKRVRTRELDDTAPDVVFLFPGQGESYRGMASGLMQWEPSFAAHLEECSNALQPHLGVDLSELLFAERESTRGSERLEAETFVVQQAALFCTEVSLARALIDLGIEPKAMLGYSFGEYVAAHIAGVLALDDAARLVVERGEILQSVEGDVGAMLAVFLPESELLPLLPEGLDLAAVSTQRSCVVSGPTQLVNDFEQQVSGLGHRSSRVPIPGAGHSSILDPVLPRLRRAFENVKLNPPERPYVSSLTGTWISEQQATDPEYWIAHTRRTVRFADALNVTAELPRPNWIELGPGHTLSVMTRSGLEKRGAGVFTSLPSAKDGGDGLESWSVALGQLWLRGAPLRWELMWTNQRRGRVSLPGTAFQRERHWIAEAREPEPTQRSDRSDTLSQRKAPPLEKVPLTEWFYTPSWVPASPPEDASASEVLLVFGSGDIAGQRVVASLLERHPRTIDVRLGESLAMPSEGPWTCPPDVDGMGAVLAETTRRLGRPNRIVHLLCYPDSVNPLSSDSVAEAQSSGFYPILALAQSLSQRQAQDPFEIVIVTTGVCAVTGDEPLHPGRATMLGPLRVLPLEAPTIAVRLVDLDARELEDLDPALLVDEINATHAPRVLALRAGKRLESNVTALSVDPTLPALPPAPKGAVLVTGGVGGIGSTLALALARSWKRQARFVLCSRTALPPRSSWDLWLQAFGLDDVTSQRIRGVRELEAQGAEVMLAAVDAADRREMQQLVSEVRSRFGSVGGFIHAAGTMTGGAIQTKRAEDAALTLRPKVDATVLLTELLQSEPLELEVYCSSLTAVAGVVGQVDYTAANAFLDAWAQYRRSQGANAISIGWDTWQGVGGAVRAALGEWQSAGRRLPVPRELQHPVFLVAKEDTESGTVEWIGRLSAAQHWVVGEHRIAGQPTLVGTAVLAWFSDLVRAVAGSGVVKLRDVSFLRALVVQQERLVRLVLTPRASDAWELKLEARPEGAFAGWESVARATASWSRSDEPHPRCELPGDVGNGTRVVAIDAGSWTGDYQTEVDFGPRFTSIRGNVRYRAGGGFAELELGAEHMAELDAWPLHPALLDLATAFLQARAPGDFVPAAWREVEVFSPLVHSIKVLAQFAEPPSEGTPLLLDVTILDDEGTVLLRASGYTLAPVLPRTAATESPRGLVCRKPGDLSRIGFEPRPLPELGPRDVVVDVHYAAIAFTEVLLTLGGLDEGQLEAHGASAALGREMAGEVVAVGSEVSQLRPGDRVTGFAEGALATRLQTDASTLARLPEGWSIGEAATFPAYSTAYHTLVELGRLQAGESVLIHAAAGGVGLAAVHIARSRGAQVFATAGRPKKRAYLHDLGVDHVYDSRSADFVESILSATGGRGVDVVLNSLSGDLLRASLEVVAAGGRFVELGLRDVALDTPLGLSAFSRGLSFIRPKANLLEPGAGLYAWLQKLVAEAERCNWPPLPMTLFRPERVLDAIRLIADGGHLGRVLLDFSGGGTPTVAKDPKRLESRRGRDATSRMLAENLSLGMAPEQGVEVFRRALAERHPHVIISTAPFEKKLQWLHGALPARPSAPQESANAHRPTTANRPELDHDPAPPTDATEERLVEIWSELLGVTPIGVHDDFFELGGNSLLGVQLAARLREAFPAVTLSPSVLLESRTISDLAARLRSPERDVAPECLVRLQRGVPHIRPVFLVHPIGGSVYFYRDLVAALGQDLPVYAFQARGFDETAEPVGDVRNMAALYLDGVRSVQPQGPYRIGGASFGGLVAFEMARQLHDTGDTVDTLFMLDTPGPGQSSRVPIDEVELVRYILALELDGPELPGDASPDERLAALGRVLEESRFFPPDGGKEVLGRVVAMMRANGEAFRNYVLDWTFPGSLLYFRATEPDAFNPENPVEPWLNRARGGTEVVTISGNHLSMNQPPNVLHVARRLREVLG